MGRLSEAEKMFRAILRAKPRDEYALRKYAQFLFYNFDKERDPEAVRYFRRVVDVCPNDFRSLFELGEALYFADANSEAIEVLTHAIEMNPSGDKAYELRSEILDELGQTEEARHDQATVRKLTEASTAN